MPLASLPRHRRRGCLKESFQYLIARLGVILVLRNIAHWQQAAADGSAGLWVWMGRQLSIRLNRQNPSDGVP